MIEVRRDGHRTLQFEGEVIGQASSHRSNARRWFEVAIYRVDGGGRYVVAGTGRTVVDGETDRYWAEVVTDPQAVITRLTRVDAWGQKYLTRTARTAIEDAASRDEWLAVAAIERA